MRKIFSIQLLLILLLSSITAGAIYAKGVTKIAPTVAEPPHPFTIVDTGERRLVDGSVAVFKLGGAETVIPLDTHKPWNTAHGLLPEGMGGGLYEVYVRTSGGTEFYVDMFNVVAPVAPPTQYMLTVNIIGNGQVILNPPGGVYDEGVAVDLTASADAGWSFTGWSGDLGGSVNPEVIIMNSDKTIIATFMENPPEPTEPYITPNAGQAGSEFTIYDPEGRMQQGDLAVFYIGGTDPMLGNTATNVVVSEDGKTMTGFVPGIAQPGTLQYVSVRPTLDALSRFYDLAFYVS